MRNKLVAILLILVLATSACVLMSCDSENAGNTDVPLVGASSTLASMPTSGTVDDYSATDNLYIAHGKLIASGSFVGVSEGSSVSLGVEQSVNTTRTVIGSSVFKQTVSLSSFVKLAEQKYVSGDNYIIRSADEIHSATDVDWADTATKVSQSDYLSLYGYTGTELSGMVLNDKTITSAELVDSSNGVYTYRYNLDCELATVYLLSEMKTSSGSKHYPEFDSASLLVSMDNNWNIISVTTDNSYSVKLGVNFNCTENITETFSQIGEVDILPESEFFGKYASASTETLKPTEQTTTDVLISMFGQYISGQPLNMSLEATVAGDSAVSGNISANIDIENLDNLSIFATLDSIDYAGVSLENIEVMYSDSTIYVQHGETKGSTTVDGITQAIGSMLSIMGSDNNLSLDIDTEELLDSIVISQTSTRITATISDLAGMGIDATIRAYKSSDNYILTDITATIGDVQLVLKPIADFSIPEIDGEYPEITTVLDIVENGKVCFDIAVPIDMLDTTINATVQADIKLGTVELYSSDVLGAKLIAKFVDNTVYLQYGEAKLCASIDDIDSLVALLATYIPELQDTELSLDIDIDSIIDSLELVTSSDSIQLSATVLGIDLVVALGSTDGWSLDSITATIPNFGNITATPTDYIAVDMGDLTQYIPVVDVVEQLLPAIDNLLNSTSQTIDISGTANISGTALDYNGTVILDNGNMSIQLLATSNSVTMLDLDIVLYNGVLYLDINGIRTALDVDTLGDVSASEIDIDSILDIAVDLLPSIQPLVEDVLQVVDKVTNLDFASIEYGTLINSLTYIDNTLAVSLDGSLLGLGNINLSLATNNNITVTLTDFSFSDIALDTTLTVSNSGTVTKPTEDYILSFEVTVPVDALDTTIVAVVNIDLLNGTVDLYSSDVLGAKLIAKFVDNTVYLQYGEAKLCASIDDIDSLVALLATYVPELTDTELSLDIDIDSIIDSLELVTSSDSIQLSATVLGIDLVVALGSTDGWSLDSITATIPNFGNITATPTEYKSVDMGDLTQYIPVVDVVEQLLPAIDNLLNSTSQTIDISGTANISGTAVQYTGVVKLDNGNIAIQLLATNNSLTMLDLDIVLYNGVLYLDINGIRTALDMNTLGDVSTSELDIDSILDIAVDLLPSIQPLVEDVLQVVDTATNLDFASIEYGTLINSLTYIDNTLAVSLDGSLLGLGDINLSLATNNNITVTLTDFSFSDIALDTTLAVSNSGTVTKPTGDYILSFEVSVPVDALDTTIVAVVNIDLLNGTVELYSSDVLGAELIAKFTDNTVYVQYGEAKLCASIDDIDSLVALLATYVPELTDTDISSIIDIDSLLSDSIGIVNTDKNVVLSLGCITVTLAKGDMLTLDNITANIGELSVVATQHSGDIPTIDNTTDFISIAEFEDIIDNALQLVQGNSVSISIENATVTLDGTQYGISGTVNISNGIELDLTLTMGDTTLANISVAIVDGIAYIDVNNIKLALDVASGSGTDDFELDSLLGYHDTVDSILLAVIDIVDTMPNIADIDMSTLISSLAFDNDNLLATLDLSQFGLGVMDIAVDSSLNVTITNLSLNNANLSVDFSGSMHSGTVVAPRDILDYTTDVVLVIDEHNTVYGNLDIYNDIYRFRLDDLYLEICGRTFYISYGDLLCRGDVDEIEGYIDDLTAIVDDFFAEYATDADNSSTADILALLDIDVHEIINSLSTTNEGGIFNLYGTVAGIDITVAIADGNIDIQLPVGSKVLELYITDSSASYFDFTDSMQYVSIEQLFSDYMPLLEDIVASNSWHFDIDMILSMDNTKYKLDGTLDFVYYNNESYSIGANIVVYKHNGSSFDKYITIDFGLVDDRIYVSYSNQSNNSSADNQLKLTVSIEAIEACVDVFEDVLDVVPQLRDLIEGIEDTLVQLGDQDDMNYSSILKHLSYTDNVFRLVIDANMLVNELGDLDITISKSDNALQLGIHNFVYDNITIEYANIAVVPQSDSTGTDNIGSYDKSKYINLDSLEQLLSTFVKTADDNSFYISGEIDASVIGIVDLTVKVDLYVDVLDTNGDGTDEVYVALKIARPKLSGALDVKKVAFDDYGGNSYLYYDGLNDTIRIVRNSYVREWVWSWKGSGYTYYLQSTKGKVSYDTGAIASTKFTDNILDYLMEILCFSDIVRNPINDAISEGNDAKYGIEDIIKTYSYNNSTFAVSADLTPMDSNLGTLYINVAHTASHTLNRLYGNTDFVGGVVDIGFDLYLKTPVPNRAYIYTAGRTLF